MLANNFIEEKIPQGSSLYYSFRTTSGDKKQAIFTLFTWFKTLEDIIDIPEYQVAEKTFAWWADETCHLQSDASHPISQALAPILKQTQLPQSHLEKICTALQSNLTTVQYANQNELNLYTTSTLSSLNLFIATLLLSQAPTQQERGAIEQLSMAMQWMKIIRSLRDDCLRGHIYLPQDLLKQHQLSSTQLLSCQQTPDSLKQLITELKGVIYTQLTSLRSTPKKFRRALAPLITQALLDWKILNLTITSGCDIFEQRQSLSPVHKLLNTSASLWQIQLGILPLQRIV
ncbi:MAG: squalene/phytoene synthase family protein [Methylococcales bacterium]|jgi:15-cis-phytoene synthase|nr:squalene/phytoene synthase family protein [Methylococcales bacterium]MBT7444873.1 squalene/phytoene synthase family protein [Methylococcales bacterium]